MSIRIEPANPYDFTTEELEQLATAMTSALPRQSADIHVRRERGHGVSHWEWIRIIFDCGADAVELATAAVVVSRYLHARWKADREAHPGSTPRGRRATIYGADGSAIKTITVDLPDGEPKEEPGAGRPTE